MTEVKGKLQSKKYWLPYFNGSVPNGERMQY